MSDPKFRPRLYLVDPPGFGRVHDTKLVEPLGSVEDAVRRRAAEMQHKWAYSTREYLHERGINQRDFAARTHLSYDRLSRVLRGDALLRLEDVAACERALGPDYRGVAAKMFR